MLDRAGGALFGLFVAVAMTASITAAYVYQWLLPIMGLVATGLVMIVVHPAAIGMRSLLSWAPLVAIGKRSYGLYLWHWPIFVFAGAIHGDVGRFVGAMVMTALVSEISYRYVETPVRTGQFMQWWRSSEERSRGWFLGIAAAVALAVTVAYVQFVPADVAVGGEQETFVAPSTTAPVAVPRTDHGGRRWGGIPTTSRLRPRSRPRLRRPRRCGSRSWVIRRPTRWRSTSPGDSGETIDVDNGAITGCSIYDRGSIRTEHPTMRNNFGMCEGWAQEWADAARRGEAEVSLVVIGAWDVFDLDIGDGTVLTFASPEWDAYFTSQLQTGIDALVSTGSQVALLEVPCMRPQDVEGAGVPALPERGDDGRVAHLNDLLRQVAAANPATTTFVAGPAEWCTDEAIVAQPRLPLGRRARLQARREPDLLEADRARRCWPSPSPLIDGSIRA